MQAAAFATPLCFAVQRMGGTCTQCGNPTLLAVLQGQGRIHDQHLPESNVFLFVSSSGLHFTDHFSGFYAQLLTVPLNPCASFRQSFGFVIALFPPFLRQFPNHLILLNGLVQPAVGVHCLFFVMCCCTNLHLCIYH